jgi:hypothetical protein
MTFDEKIHMIYKRSSGCVDSIVHKLLRFVSKLSEEDISILKRGGPV